jgi:diaminopimelate decarboxylase
MSFMVTFLYHLKPQISVITRSKGANEFRGEKLSTIWGCSCNSNDKITGDLMLKEMEMGDWIVFHNMGAYTLSVATKFNGFHNDDVIVGAE